MAEDAGLSKPSHAEGLRLLGHTCTNGHTLRKQEVSVLQTGDFTDVPGSLLFTTMTSSSLRIGCGRTMSRRALEILAL